MESLPVLTRWTIVEGSVPRRASRRRINVRFWQNPVVPRFLKKGALLTFRFRPDGKLVDVKEIGEYRIRLDGTPSADGAISSPKPR